MEVYNPDNGEIDDLIAALNSEFYQPPDNPPVKISPESMPDTENNIAHNSNYQL